MTLDLVEAKPLRNPIPEITRDDRLMLEGEPWLLSGNIPNGYAFNHALEPWRDLELSYDQIWRYLKAKKAWIDEGAENPQTKALDIVFSGRKLGDFSKKSQTRANLRKALFETYEESCLISGHISRSGDKFQAWIDEKWPLVVKRTRCDVPVTQFPSPTTSTFNRRYRDFRASNRNILSLIPKHVGPGKKTVCWSPEALDFATVAARGYMSRLKPTKALVYGDYKALLSAENERRGEETEHLYQFSRTKFNDIIDSFPAFDVVAAREGEAYALKYFAPSLRSYNVLLPGKRVEIDEWKGDLCTFFAKAGALEGTTPEQRAKLRKIRLWLVFVIDVATRYVLAVKVAPSPNTEAALGALRMVMSDKTMISKLAGAETPWIGECKPKLVVSDHGSALTSDEVTGALNALNISATRPQAGTPKKRPFIESLFHTIGPFLTRFFDGQTFRNIREKGDYDPKKHASLAAGEFSEIVVQCVCDFYHRRPHGSLGGRSPHDAWVDAVETYKVTPSPQQFELLRAFGKIEKATINKYGIVKHDVSYFNQRLAEESLDRRHFEIKYDSSCINAILVKAKNDEWFEVPNTIELIDDLALTEWDESRKEFLMQNLQETDEGYRTQRDFILRNRQNGKAATLRAGLDPVVPSHAKLAKMRSKIYTGIGAGPVTGAPMETSAPILPPVDELRGNVVERARPVELQPAPAPVAQATSNLSRTKWDD